MGLKTVRVSEKYALNYSFLIELFLLLGFFRLTYTYNIYIFYGIALLPIMLYKKQTSVLVLLLFYLLLSITIPYFFIHDARATFRVLKTLIIFLPLLSFYSIKNVDFRLSSLFRGFMTVSAILVCIDFCLFFLTGRMLMGGTESGFLPRPRGLMEDSNFFSYLMVVYIYYLKRENGKYNLFFIVSLILSGSLAAIICFFFLQFLFWLKGTFKLVGAKTFKYLTIFIIGLLFFGYFSIAFNYNSIMEDVAVAHLDGVQKVKYASLMMRFGAQNEALMMIDSPSKILFGIGAGNTMKVTEREMNLHNTYLQLLLEQGMLVFSFFFLLIVAMVSKIKDNYYVVIFCIIFMLGTILEVFYFPLLSFVFFISFISYKNINDKRTQAF